MGVKLKFSGSILICNPILSLQRLAAVKIVTVLFNHEQVKSLKDQRRSSRKHKVDELIRELLLSRKLEKKVSGVADTTSEAIFSWEDFHKKKFDILSCYDVDYSSDLFWTCFGTIDWKKTAETLVKNSNIDYKKRLDIACIYCITTDVLYLWEHNPGRRKSFARRYKDRPSKMIKIILKEFWSGIILLSYIQEHSERINKSLPIVVPEDVLYRSKALIEYYLPKLAPEKITETMQKFISNALTHNCVDYKKRTRDCKCYDCGFSGRYVEVIFYLLSQLSPNEQCKIFQQYSFLLLQCFLDRPWLDCFQLVSKYLVEFCTGEDIYHLLRIIVQKHRKKSRDCDYLQLLSDLWKNISDLQKRQVLQNCATEPELLLHLFYIGAEGNYRLIVKECTQKEMDEILKYYGASFSHDLSYEEHAIGLFSEECESRRANARQLWNEHFLFLKAVVSEEKQKKTVQSEHNSSKRPRSDSDGSCSDCMSVFSTSSDCSSDSDCS